MQLIKKLLNIKPAYVPKTYDLNSAVSFFNWDRRTIVGHMYQPQKGDIFRTKMESGKYALFTVIKVRWCGDPGNMYFADVKDLGYEGEV